MLIGIQAMGWTSIGRALLDEIRAREYHAARLQLQNNEAPFTPVLSDTEAATLVQEVIDADLHPYTNFRHARQLAGIPVRRYAEFGNEPDLGKRFGWGKHGRDYLAAVPEVIRNDEGQHDLAVGVVSNLNERGFDFLEAMRWDTIPGHVICAFHRYPDGDDPNPAQPDDERRFKGADHRDREIEELKRIVGPGRRLICSEVGYHTAHGATDEQVAESMAFEKSLFERHGIECAIAYQLIDGPGAHYDNHFGHRHMVDATNPLGPWKPVSAAWTGVPL